MEFWLGDNAKVHTIATTTAFQSVFMLKLPLLALVTSGVPQSKVEWEA